MRTHPYARHHPLTVKKVDRAIDAIISVAQSRDALTFITSEERRLLHEVQKALRRVSIRIDAQ